MAHDMNMPREERSIGELFADLTRELANLFRQEMTLAKAEMSHKAGKVGKDVGFIAAGGMVAYIGALALVASIILMLVEAGLAPWLSALIVGGIITAIGGYLVMKGLGDLKETNMAPTETMQSVKEDTKWIKGTTT